MTRDMVRHRPVYRPAWIAVLLGVAIDAVVIGVCWWLIVLILA